MTRLRLEDGKNVLSLSGIEDSGYGVQAVSGASGFGLPPVSVQWLEGAGDGSTYRGERQLSRDIDLPLHFLGRNRDDLRENLSLLNTILAGGCLLIFTGDDSVEWQAEVHRTGGGDYVWGTDTNGNTWLDLVVSVRSGDPYFSAVEPHNIMLGGRGVGGRGLLPDLVNLRVSPSQAIGTISLENIGDAPSYPIWTVNGPGRDFRAVSPTGETIEWFGTLAPDEKLYIDSFAGTVIDNSGRNRYADLGPAPRFWAVPPGVSVAEASLQETTVGHDVDGVLVGASYVACSFRPRKWLVI